MKMSVWTLLCGVACLLFTAPPAAAATLVKVGSDSACDYASISSAVLHAPGTDMLGIVLARNASFSGPNLIFGREVHIYGGYDTCADTVASGRTLIDGSGFSGSPLVLTGGYSNPDDYKVYLFNIEIAHGQGSSAYRGGGMNINGPFHVFLSNTYIHDNTAYQDGGGIYIKGEPGVSNGVGDRTSLTVQGNSIISENNATNGGGIACEDRVLVFSHHSQIGGNRATTTGGGIAANSCYIFLGSHGPLQGIVSNQTTGSNGKGGGIYAVVGTVLISASKTEPSQVFGNRADKGGGVYIQYAKLFAYDADIINNTAVSSGGGIFADGEDGMARSTVVMGRLRAGANCHAALRCSNLSNNKVLANTGSGGGGGLYAKGGLTIISGTFIEGNSAATGNGVAVMATQAPGINHGLDTLGLQLYASVVARNGSSSSYSGADASIVTISDTSANVGYLTFVDNASVPRVVYTPTTTYDPEVVYIYGTIFANTSGATSDYGALIHSAQTADGSCNDLSESSSDFAQKSERSEFDGYDFVDAPSGDYRLSVYSADIDYCNIAMPAYVIDAGGGPRPYDDPVWNALYGNHDLGALERHPDDLIFRNGLE